MGCGKTVLEYGMLCDDCKKEALRREQEEMAKEAVKEAKEARKMQSWQYLILFLMAFLTLMGYVLAALVDVGAGKHWVDATLWATLVNAVGAFFVTASVWLGWT